MEAAQITGEVAMYRTAQKHQAQADKEKATGCRPVDQSASSRQTDRDRDRQRPAETPADWHRDQQTIRGQQKRRQTGTEASRRSEADRNAGRLAQRPADDQKPAETPKKKR